ncbi:TauD/TfdA family dioxygenase [Paenibacillus larvae]|uniref:TauD/TfdA family dioxygenase n=1 Tax=Paenibacillus larvae TaxID=1464 RepID=UPI00098F3B68|nr:hypothetical protein B5S25_04200 [Paenibacillus larvae subsp. pulvifaciens]
MAHLLRAANKDPRVDIPIFTYRNALLSAKYTRRAIHLAEKAFGVKISDIQREALDLFDSITFNPDFQLVMKLEPGDMQFLNNHVVIHSRTEFEDYEDPKLKRHLLRLWLSIRNSRKEHPITF